MELEGTSLWMLRVQRRRRRARGALVSVLVAAALLAVYAFLRSPYFAVEYLRISGYQRLTPEEIRQLSGVAPGTLIWRVDPEAVGQRIARHPRVGAVEVRREWPRGLAIRLRERRTVAVVAAAGEPTRWAEVDADGVLVAVGSGSPSPPEGVPRLELPSPPRWRGGERLPGPARAAVRVVAAASAAGLSDPLRGARLLPDGSLRMTLASGVEVRWGAVDEGLDAKLRALQGVLAALAEEPAPPAYVDVTDPQRPVAGR